MVRRTAGMWVFTLIRPGAQRAYLVGDFAGWSTTSIQMKRNTFGIWETSLSLEPGVYRFRYFADDQWLTDYAAFGVECDRTGAWNSVLWVPPESVPARPAVRRVAVSRGAVKRRSILHQDADAVA